MSLVGSSSLSPMASCSSFAKRTTSKHKTANVRKEKYLDNKTDNETPADETIDIANDINKKNLSENSAEETVVKKSAKSQTELD